MIVELGFFKKNIRVLPILQLQNFVFIGNKSLYFLLFLNDKNDMEAL